MKVVYRKNQALNKDVLKKKKNTAYSLEELHSIHEFKEVKKMPWAKFELFCAELLEELTEFRDIRRASDKEDFMGIDLFAEYQGEAVAIQCKHRDRHSGDMGQDGIYFMDILKFFSDIQKYNYHMGKKVKHAVYIASAPQKYLTDQYREVLEKREINDDLSLWIVDSDGINHLIRRAKRNYNSTDNKEDGFKGSLNYRK